MRRRRPRRRSRCERRAHATFAAPAAKPADAGPDDHDPNPFGRTHEAHRWERGIRAVAKRTDGHPVIHLLDSEGEAG